jgi:hypothetical protein
MHCQAYQCSAGNLCNISIKASYAACQMPSDQVGLIESQSMMFCAALATHWMSCCSMSWLTVSSRHGTSSA